MMLQRRARSPVPSPSPRPGPAVLNSKAPPNRATRRLPAAAGRAPTARRPRPRTTAVSTPSARGLPMHLIGGWLYHHHHQRGFPASQRLPPHPRRRHCRPPPTHPPARPRPRKAKALNPARAARSGSNAAAGGGGRGAGAARGAAGAGRGRVGARPARGARRGGGGAHAPEDRGVHAAGAEPVGLHQVDGQQGGHGAQRRGDPHRRERRLLLRPLPRLRASKKIEEVLKDVNYIRYLKTLPMDCFESEIWNKFGKKTLPMSDRRKNLDWDPSKTRLYHCNVEQRDDSIVTIFKGPYVEDTRTHLQKVVGDDNVLIVKFSDINIHGYKNNADKLGIYCKFYNQVAQHGILLGLRRYRYFIHKDGGKEEKQKEAKKKERSKKCSPSVRCYFVRTESGWDRDEPYILTGHTVDQARRRFMHIHNAPTLSKYLARFALILSKTITLGIDDFSKVNVRIIEDIPCKDEHGNIIEKDGEPLIHTDGTGLISHDLAVNCPTSVFKGNYLKAHELQDTVDSKKRQYLREHPLLMQFRMFYKGSAAKGTALVDKTLPERTIQIRHSMIKINADPSSSGEQSFNSLEVVTTSNRPRKALTSRYLIALLCHGGVQADYFLELLGKALEDVNKARHKARDVLEVASNHADMDDFMSARMILSGIEPKDEAYLQYQLALMTKAERKRIQQGRIPIDDCYYLMGTTDPTGTLKRDQVCVIHDNGQVSGKVLVYKHPGLHFGDIHRLTAMHIDGLEKIVGNSRYAIFFPTTGPRSLADEMANSDFDGDMYWVSWNPQLLEQFEPGKPWEPRTQPKKIEQKKPQDCDGPELECLLFREFLKARFLPSYERATAANYWLALMDRLLTPGVSEGEQDSVKTKMLDLVDIYYLALDASKNGYKITIPEYLMVKQYPHFLERKPSYQSTSVLGKIYDEAKSQQFEGAPQISIVPLKCFAEEAVYQGYKIRWTCLYREYLAESCELCQVQNKEEVNFKFRELYQKYKQILYEAEEFERSPRSRFDLFNEACAVYQVVYECAVDRSDVRKCGFAWKVAGHALCEYYLLKHGGPTVTCLRAVLEDAFKKNRG